MKSTLRSASGVAKVFSLTVRVMALWVVLGGGGQPAYASHFRYGHINWAPLSGNTIQFTVQNAFRRSFLPSVAYECLDPATVAPGTVPTIIPCTAADGLPGPGDVFVEDIGFTQFLPGDGSSIDSPLGTLLYVVTSIDPTNEWLFALALDPTSLPAIDTTITYTYPSAGNFTVAIDSCCRISPVPFAGTNAHINNPDGGYRVETVVNVGTGNSSPVTALPPIILCPINALCSFQVPGVDPNGDPLHFRLSTAPEASSDVPTSACLSTFCQPGPPFAPNAASISSTGLYTWDTTGATLGDEGFATLYSTQVTIEDLDAAGNVKSKVAVDFFIQLVPVEVGSPPVFSRLLPGPRCESATPTLVSIGTTQSFTVQSSDPDPGQTVTLNAAGLPAGATMTPLLPTSGNPVSSTFSWTPTAADAGTYVITFTATDNSGAQAGLQTLCPISLAVSGGTGGGGSCAAPAAGSCSLGQANGYAAFIMGNVAGTKSAISEGSTKITGNVAIGSSASGSSTDLLKATIEGKLLLDPAAVVNIHPDLTVTGGIVTQSLTTARNNALAASACYAALAPTRTISSITSSTTITGNGGLNVINVGSIVLVKKVLTLKGGPNDIFIINVSGDFSMGSSQVVLAGGVTAGHVLWNFPGTGTSVKVYKGVTSASGTFLVPYRDYVQDVATLYGSVLSGGNVRIHSGAKVTCPAS